MSPMPVPMQDGWKKRRFWIHERKILYNRAFEKAKYEELKKRRQRREQEIQEKAQQKAFRKYGMTRKQKIGHVIQRIQKGMEKAQKELEWMQQDLENDMRNERHL